MSGDPNPGGSSNPVPPPSGNPLPKFPCGQAGQPACPPEPAVTGPTLIGNVYTVENMREHGHNSYQKGREDALKGE